MPEISISPTRARVYHLAVDGKGPDAGLCVTSIVKEMLNEGIKITRQAVEKHIEKLREDRYIARMRGTARPALYVRGERAGILDAVLCNPSGNPSNVEGGNEQNCRQPDKNTSAYIPSGEAHVDNCYIFPVIKPGDLFHPLRIGEEKVTVFETRPKQMNNGVMFYKGAVPLDDDSIKVQYWVGPEGESLHVWPTPVGLTPGRPERPAEELADKAQMVVNVLSRYGGWRFGIPRFVGKIHYATNDPAVLGNFKDGVQLAKETGCWLDSTPPPRAFETTDAERMDGVINYHAIAEGLRANIDMLEGKVEDYEAYKSRIMERLDFMDLRADRLERVLIKMQSSSERTAMTVQSIIEQEAAKVIERDHGDPGVMYS